MKVPCGLILALLCISICSYGQNENAVSAIPVKYITEVNSKIDKYSSRLNSKTEKTLQKLAKWENKIHNLLQKADPATGQKLFAPGKPTFASILQKVKEGKTLAENYKAKYDSYRDKLTVNLKYIDSKKDSLDKKFVQPLAKAKEKAAKLEESVTESEAAEELIKERKKELMAESMKVLGKSKYLTKINKESYYYIESLKNYKELFNDTKKAEELAKKVLNNIPAFNSFMQKNSALASFFGNAGNSTNGAIAQNLTGLQTRVSVNSLIQTRIAQGGPNAAAQVSQSIQSAQAQIQQLKDKIIKAGGGGSDANMPDFKPNTQRSKTFRQRLDLGSNFQFGKPNRFTKSVADIGFSIGYKLNDKSTAGVGIAYKMGYGTLSKIRISHEGIGLRSFIDYKLKKQFFITGGYEMNYNTLFTNLRSLQSKEGWQQSGLVGISKKLKIKTKFIKGTKFQMLYDMLYKTHLVATPAFVFRVGYDFK